MSDFTQPTIEAFKGFIDRPPMDPKHLSRPPFLFILQVFVEVSNKTGFGRGLYTNDELAKEYYTEPTKKVMFLKKLVSVIKSIEGNIDISVENIVRGTECEKTNTLLQKLASAAKKGTKTDDIVQNILNKIAGKTGAAEGTQNTAALPKETPQQQATAQVGGHMKEVNEMAKGANIGKGGKDAEGDDASKIRMGTLNRGARKDTKTDGKAVADAEPGQAVTSLDSMKEAIQNITQSINPMGKIIQFIDDDIESMKREYDGWARMYANSQEQLEDKEKIIEAELQPYKDKIVGKEEQIREKKGQIDSLKSKILRSNLKIKKLLSDIIGAN